MDKAVGVLALQGAYQKHIDMLQALGVAALTVRYPHELDDCSALIIPGGESTTMRKLIERWGLRAPILDMAGLGAPILGTCAGMILLASEVLDGRPDQRSFGVIDISVRRNGYGRQLDSFETELLVPGLGIGADRFHGVFIRAPKVTRVGADVEVLAEHAGVPVLLRHGPITVASFHPELANDPRLHAQFLDSFLTTSQTEI